MRLASHAKARQFRAFRSARSGHSRTPPRSAVCQTAVTVPARGQLRSADGRLELKNFTLQELEAWLAAHDANPQWASAALFYWMYNPRHLLTSSDMHRMAEAKGRMPVLKRSLVELLMKSVSLDSGLLLSSSHTASDGTIKLLFNAPLASSNSPSAATIETVLIPMGRRGRVRYTACVSSQVGCAMNCQFCYTGRMGLAGGLSAAQIVDQVVCAMRFLREQGSSTPIGNIVFMGMGEPLDNLEHVLAATSILTTHRGLRFAASKVIVSTVGVVPALREFAAQSPVQVAVSLHATTQEVRDWIVPVNRRYSLPELIGALEELFPVAASAPGHGRFVLIEYVMLAGVNDTDDDARRLLCLLEHVYCAINLIMFNPFEGTRFRPSALARVLAFRRIVQQGGKFCSVRQSRGDDEMAACGQLGSPDKVERRAPLLAVPERFRDVMECVSGEL